MQGATTLTTDMNTAFTLYTIARNDAEPECHCYLLGCGSNLQLHFICCSFLDFLLQDDLYLLRSVSL